MRVEQVAQRDGRCPVLGDIHGQVGWGPEKPDQFESVFGYCSRLN